MMASLFLSRVLGVARDATMSGMFGSNIETDAYRLAFQVPDLLFFLVAGGALSSAFIPVFSEYFHTDREEDAWKVFSVVASVMSLAVLAFIAFAWVFAEPLARLVAPGKPDHLFPIIAQMSRIVLPAQFAFFLGGLMFGTLYSRNLFAVPGLGPNVYNLGIIFGAVAISWFVTPAVAGMSWGALIGAFVGNFFLPLWAMRRLGSRFSFSLDLSHPGVKRVFRLMVPVALGLSLPGVYGFIIMAFGSFYGAGVVTWLDYANRLMQAPLGVFGQSLAIAVFPTLARHFAQKEMGLYRAELSKTLRAVLYIAVPVSALMFVLAPEIVAVLYQHGRFLPKDTVGVAWLLQLFSIGVFAWCLHPVLMRGFFAVQDSLTPIVLGTVTSVVFVGLVLGLRQTELGAGSLPLASSIAAVLLAALLTVAAGRRIGGLDVAGILRTLGSSLFATLLSAGFALVAVMWVRGWADLGQKVPAGVAALLIGLGAAWLYYAVTKALGMPETNFVSKALSRNPKPPNPPKES